jgi:hypothetical protein
MRDHAFSAIDLACRLDRRSGISTTDHHFCQRDEATLCCARESRQNELALKTPLDM